LEGETAIGIALEKYATLVKMEQAAYDQLHSAFMNLRGLFASAGTVGFAPAPGGCPLILDLNGDGVKTRNVTAGAFFDHDKNGLAQQTGWVSASDGLLVRDCNGNGRIDDGTELFGDNTILKNGNKAPTGFQALADLDDNGDGK